MTTVDEALEILRGALGPARTGLEHVPLPEAQGRRLARDVTMDHDVPPFDRVAMDGYAIPEPPRVGLKLPVGGSRHAGDSTQTPLLPGTALRVMTGAAAPRGTLCVVPFEWTQERDGHVELLQVPSDATNLVARGRHCTAGEAVLRRGERVSAAGLAALATAGCTSVPVAPRPRVTVLGTGSELVAPSETPGPAAIRNSNNSLLLGLARAAGAAPEDHGFVADREELLRAAIRDGLHADLLCLTGGVSQGDRDLVPAALLGEGVQCLFHRWQVQPGGPLWFGRHAGGFVLALPGNPAAVTVGFEILAVPLLRALQGVEFAAREVLRAHYEGPWGAAFRKRRYRPVTLRSDSRGQLWARALAWEGSGDPFSFVGADGLAIIPEDQAQPADPLLLDVIPLAERLS